MFWIFHSYFLTYHHSWPQFFFQSNYWSLELRLRLEPQLSERTALSSQRASSARYGEMLMSYNVPSMTFSCFISMLSRFQNYLSGMYRSVTSFRGQKDMSRGARIIVQRLFGALSADKSPRVAAVNGRTESRAGRLCSFSQGGLVLVQGRENTTWRQQEANPRPQGHKSPALPQY